MSGLFDRVLARLSENPADPSMLKLGMHHANELLKMYGPTAYALAIEQLKGTLQTAGVRNPETISKMMGNASLGGFNNDNMKGTAENSQIGGVLNNSAASGGIGGDFFGKDTMQGANNLNSRIGSVLGSEAYGGLGGFVDSMGGGAAGSIPFNPKASGGLGGSAGGGWQASSGDKSFPVLSGGGWVNSMPGVPESGYGAGSFPMDDIPPNITSRLMGTGGGASPRSSAMLKLASLLGQ